MSFSTWQAWSALQDDDLKHYNDGDLYVANQYPERLAHVELLNPGVVSSWILGLHSYGVAPEGRIFGA